MVMYFSKEPRKKEINDETWMWKRNMNIGTQNVRSLFWSGTLKVLHNELLQLDYDVVARQETSGSKNLITLLYLTADQKAKNMKLAADFMQEGNF